MAPSLWNIMKRSTSDSPPQSKLQRMAPGIVTDSSESRSTGSSLEAASQVSYTTRDEDYDSFMSDVMVVGAGPAGLMLA